MQEENYGRMNLASQTAEDSVDAWDEALEEELEEEPKEKKHLLKKKRPDGNGAADRFVRLDFAGGVFAALVGRCALSNCAVMV